MSNTTIWFLSLSPPWKVFSLRRYCLLFERSRIRVNKKNCNNWESNSGQFRTRVNKNLCANRESNSGQLLGRQLCYHYTIGALENRGIEPLTSCMLSRRSTNWANPPRWNRTLACSHELIKLISLKLSTNNINKTPSFGGSNRVMKGYEHNRMESCYQLLVPVVLMMVHNLVRRADSTCTTRRPTF